jgi:hypothetical protein
MQNWEEGSLKPKIGNDSLHQDSNDDVKMVNFATSKNLAVAMHFSASINRG